MRRVSRLSLQNHYYDAIEAIAQHEREREVSKYISSNKLLASYIENSESQPSFQRGQAFSNVCVPTVTALVLFAGEGDRNTVYSWLVTGIF